MNKKNLRIIIGMAVLIIASIFLSANQVEAGNTSMACAAAPAGLVSWWQAEGNAVDAFVIHNGTLMDGVTFAQGMVGNSFSLNGQSYIAVPDRPALNPNNITVDAWILRNSNAIDYGPIVVKRGINDLNGYSLETGFGEARFG